MRYPGSELYPKIMTDKFHTIIVVDLETTGLDPWRCEILTWSMSAVDYFTLQRKASIELTFRPQNLAFWDYIHPEAIARAAKRKKPIKKASEIHGISLSQALYFDDKNKSTALALEFIGDHCGGIPQTFLCHAFDLYQKLGFMDLQFVMSHLIKMDTRDGGLRRDHFYKNLRFFESTESYFREARRRGYYRAGGSDLFSQVAEDEEGDNFKLDTLCRHYKIPYNHHNAQADRESCEALYAVARSLGTNDDEDSFDLQGTDDGEALRGGAQGPDELRSGPGWGAYPYQVGRAEEEVQVYETETE